MYEIYNGDCCQKIKDIKSESVHMSIFSPPFAELYVYSDLPEDMGNSKDYEEFFTHFNFLLPELNRILIPGRIVAVHCMDIPAQKEKDGYIGYKNFSDRLVREFEGNGFVYHDRVTIWKDPVVEMQRTKALGLLHKQLRKDATMSRTGTPDYLLLFRKKGVNPVPVTHQADDPTKGDYIPVDLWQKYASPVWYDINYSDTLQFRTAKDNKDEKHIAPLQLPTIERAIKMWSNEGETIFTPFMGIGSEVYQAIKMGRKGVGIELKPSYFKVAEKNCKNALESKSQLSFV
ncbi:MAG TPA: site-specific DNA-methyltransferase [Bacteroidia bacterium]|nr:site-specific DNA-methyltransferase [Bacteroidia bacterium]